MRNTLTGTFIAFIIALAGGGIFYILHLPLPWTLGAMTAAAITAFAGGKWVLHNSVRNYARPVIGVLAGSSFTPAIVASIGQWWPAVVTVLLYTIVTLFLGYAYFARIGGYNRVTSYFAAAPGGLAELTLLGGSLGGDYRQLVLVHAIRIVILVFCIPFIITFLTGTAPVTGAGTGSHGTMTLLDAAILTGCVLGAVFLSRFVTKLPGGLVISAIFLSSLVHAFGLTDAAPPYWLVALVQVVIGSTAGSRFIGVRWREMLMLMVHATVWAVFLIISATGVAWLTLHYLDQPAAAMTLAFMPGGTAEMIVISYAIGIEVAFVVTVQVCRIVAVHLFAPLFFKLLRIEAQPEDKGPD